MTPTGAANLPSFQGAWPDHVQVVSSSCCFPRELVSFDLWHVTRSLPIRKCIWSGKYNKTHNLDSWTQKTWLAMMFGCVIYLPHFTWQCKFYWCSVSGSYRSNTNSYKRNRKHSLQCKCFPCVHKLSALARDWVDLLPSSSLTHFIGCFKPSPFQVWIQDGAHLIKMSLHCRLP